MKTRTFCSIINAVTWMLIGMVLMSRYLCISMGITSRPHYVGWDNVAYILGGLAGMHLVMWFDPTFKEQ